MNDIDRQLSQDDILQLAGEVASLREAVMAQATTIAAEFGMADAQSDPALRNLSLYLALRRHDIRTLQRHLMRYGLSSLGRLESRVQETLDSVSVTLAALAGTPCDIAMPDEQSFFAGEARLAEASDVLLGPVRSNRRTRIMVTLPSEAAGMPEFLLELARRGMDIARINCAHDDAAAWRQMAEHVRAAAGAVGRDIAVLMDIAGPKIRTGAVVVPDKKARLQVGDRIRLVAEGAPGAVDGIGFSAGVSVPEIVTRLSVGDRLRYDDGKVEAVVESAGGGEAVIRVTKTKAKGAKLKPEKGINLPDTILGLSPLTSKDEADLSTVIECADLLGYSFVSRPEDIDLLEAQLAAHGGRRTPLGLVAKIEQPEALRNLPALIARARSFGPFGVMIARGDLAAEIGFERLAEMQEELLWICEAASVPVIWATQVLEGLVQDGIPSRGEMTDAVMAARAECVMLNKGPAIYDGVSLLDSLLGRMDAHFVKKTPTLRALKSW